jgi:hypothetical protein
MPLNEGNPIERLRVLVFIQRTATVAVVAMGCLVVLIALDAAVRRWDRFSAASGPGRSVLPAIEHKYGIEVLENQRYPVTTYHGLIRATNAETAELDRYRKILAQEIQRYPRDLIRQSRLRRIILCRDLSFDGQNRAAVPDFEHDTLYLDVVAGDYDRAYQCQAIHHDFFHIIDYQDDGELYSDDRWAKLNIPSFQYGSGGVSMQDDPASGMPWDSPGFLNKYSTSGVEEDKAEIFAHMMTDYALIEKRAASDDVIRKKMSLMKTLLAKFCPAMNASFWNQLALKLQQEANRHDGENNSPAPGGRRITVR